ncbi:hypothetical protein, partial [Aliikangiella maris]
MARVSDLRQWLMAAGEVDLLSLAYTLQIGREALDERLSVVVGSVEALLARLDAVLGGESGGEIYRGTLQSGQSEIALLNQDEDMLGAVGRWIAQGKLHSLAALWVKGLQIDWLQLYGGLPEVIHLPGYPFARERYWVDTSRLSRELTGRAGERESQDSARQDSVLSQVIHPLLQVNCSRLDETIYESELDSQLLQRLGYASSGLSVGVSLVMMHQALQAGVGESSLVLRNLVWGEPVDLSSACRIGVSLRLVAEGQIGVELYQVDARQTIAAQGLALLHESFDKTLLQKPLSVDWRLPLSRANRDGLGLVDECLV